MWNAFPKWFLVGINVVAATTNGVILGMHLERGRRDLAIITVVGVLIGWAAIAALMIPSSRSDDR